MVFKSLYYFICSFFVLCFATISLGFSKKNKVEPAHVDVSLKSLGGPLTFDKKTKEALDRSKDPNVLLAEREEADCIYKITIKDAKKVEPSAVLLRLITKIGEKYNELNIAKDINSILEMGLFEDVKVYKNILPSKAVELQFVLVETPTIFQVKLEGSTLGDDEIKEVILGLENYQVANFQRINEFAKKITDFYISKGYFLAIVEPKVRPTSLEDIKKRENETEEQPIASGQSIETTKVIAPDFVDVIFHIKENKKVSINKITFQGLNYLKEDNVRQSIRTQEKHILSVISDWGTFKKDFLDIDQMILEKILHDNGFLQGKVLEPIYELSLDKSKIDIYYKVLEGKQFFLGNVSVFGDLVEANEAVYRLKKDEEDEAVFFSKKLESLITLKKRDVFNKSQIGQDILSIAEKYKDAGYAYVNVNPEPVIYEDSQEVDLKINIQSGPKVWIELIEIVGNEKTKDEVIRRELKLDEGDLYSQTLFKLSEYNVQRLGYFESVEFSTANGSEDNLMIIKILVKEKSTGSIQVGAGYGTGGEGLVLRGQVTNHNLFGRGQMISAKVDYSSYRRIVDLGFQEPYLTYILDNPLSFGFTLYNRNMFMGEFSKDSTGGDITFGYPIGGPFSKFSRKWQKGASRSSLPYILDFDSLWFYLSYNVERVEINDATVDVRVFDLHQGEPRYTTSLKPAIRLDQRDNYLSPTRGYYGEFRTEFASAFFGSKALSSLENKIFVNKRKDRLKDGLDYLKTDSSVNNFIKYGTNLRYYYSFDEWFFIKGFVLKSNLEIGFLNTLGEPLMFENYALGGGNTVRGYQYRSISPVKRVGASFPFDPRKDFAIGGDKQIFGNIELEFPIIKMLKLSGVIFFDFGNVYSNEDNLFYFGQKSKMAQRISPKDPLKNFKLLGLYASSGFGIRWVAGPLGFLRFEFGFPLNPRPKGTPGLLSGDGPMVFEFNMGPNF